MMIRYLTRFRSIFYSIAYASIFSSTVAYGAESLRLKVSPELLAKVESIYGIEAMLRVVGWRRYMDVDRESDTVDDRIKIQHANDYFNKVRWLADIDHWGKEDYWATPLETLATNGGDCEDFSIGKYFSLIESLVNQDKLRITYVKSTTFNQPHMVLAYYETPSSEPLILDNIDKMIKPASERPDLVPIYSFSGSSIWLAKERGKQLNGNSMVNLPQWKRVNERLMSLDEG